MNISLWLKKSKNVLEDKAISTATLDIEILLADTLKKDRSWLHAHPEYELTNKQVIHLQKQVSKRVNHEPMAYIRGKQEFYGREFIVSPDTLTPRPETETMVELLLQIASDGKFKTKNYIQITDVGTGSGCIIITASLELPKKLTEKHQISYQGLDISKNALIIAKKNAKKLKANVDFQHFDLKREVIPNTDNTYQILLCNLPYVPNDFQINLDASHEPKFAIYGGDDGLDYYRSLFQRLNSSVKHILTESLPPQHDALAKIARQNGYKYTRDRDLIQVFSSLNLSCSIGQERHPTLRLE